MSGGIRLDIDPRRWDKTEGIKCEDISNHSGYNSYKYYSKPNGEEPFTLSAILYEGSLLKGIIPCSLPVKTIFTYFNSDKTNILLIHIVLSSGPNWYCTNPDTTLNLEKNTFTRFIPEDGKVLDPNDLEIVLDNITKNSSLDLITLKSNNGPTAIKLVSSSDVVFDLTQKPITSGGTGKYQSEVTSGDVTVSPDSSIGGRFTKTEHTANSCNIRGIKLGKDKYMRVGGGFPNDLITGFYVYYSDATCDTPLLVELKLDVQAIDEKDYVPSRYILSKNTKDGGDKKWNIRKIGSYVGDELGKILRNISENSKLDVDKLEDYQDLKKKLGDISDGITVDITRTFEQTGDNDTKHYDSGVRIPYKTSEVGTYYVVRHPYFPSFTLKSITTGISTEINKEQLPPPGTEIWRLQVYCTDSGYKSPVLIEVICKYEKTEGYPKYVYYYSLDNRRWKGYLLSTKFKNVGTGKKGGEDITDLNNVITHVKSNDWKIVPSKFDSNLEGKLVEYPYVTLNVTINVSQSGGTYTPKDSNGTQFIVRKSHVDSNFYKFTHAAEDNARFKVKSVTYGKNSTLNNIKTYYSIISISAYYFGESPKEEKNLVLIQLGEGDSSVYYTIEGDNNWKKSEKTNDKNLKENLGKEYCKRNQGHIINLSATSEPYKCPSCNNEQITVSGPNQGTSYLWCEHTISGGNSSISGFKYGDQYQAGFKKFEEYDRVKAFWYPLKDGSPLLIYFSLDSAFMKRISKTSNSWEEVQNDAPESDDDGAKILKLLKKINGDKEGPSGGEIAGYTATGVMTPLATAEAVNYTLDTGWSLIRRVMAIFNAAI